MEMISAINDFGAGLLGPTLWLVVWTVIKIVLIAVPIILCVAYKTYWERKMIGFMHVRVGPTRVGYRGLLQPFADVFKLLTKEVIVPAEANTILYVLPHVERMMPGLAGRSVFTVGPQCDRGNVNAA